ncbi:MAG: HAMP domain-containing sensor histidine kinase [Acidimicrobiia bacterium]|nr:MAG: HAMP domain-containing sensor histidine kinase [Acidimicrobiia bacterium]
MRRWLILLTAAVTGIVVLAFLVPLFILVGDLARDDATAAAERDAESLARVLSVLVIDQEIASAIEVVGEDRIVAANASVISPDGSVVGLAVPEDEDVLPAQEGSSFAAPVDGGVGVYVPVLTGEGPAVVVRVFVPDADLNEGVARSRVILGALGLVLVVIAAWMADRLGRSMVEPVKELSDNAIRLGHGDLNARVVPGGPPEIEEAGLEFNRLAEQIGRLLQEERETAADLAHRLRTPLTAARLSVDGLEEGSQKERLIADLDELQRTTDFIIREARRPVRRAEEEWCDLALVTAERSEFWLPLASEQTRDVSVLITADAVPIPLPTGDVVAAVDALIENVLAHTPDGVAFSISVEVGETAGVLCVEDAGSGFQDGSALDRGTSDAGSTGLGLDIVRRTVEDAGGSLAIGESRSLGGAGIVITLPLTPGS